MTTGWIDTTLGKVAELRPAKRQVKTLLAENDLVSFVPMTQLSETDHHFVEAEKKPLSSVYGGYTYFADGDVLLAKITPCFENGKMGLAKGLTNGVGFGSSEYFVLRSGESLDPRFLTYYLDQDRIRTAGQAVMGGAVGHKRVPKEFVKSLRILLPPLNEQKRIVAMLDEAFEALNRARDNVETNLESSTFMASLVFDQVLDKQECLAWIELQEACEAFEYGTSSKSFPEGRVPVLRMGNIQSGELDWKKLKYSNNEEDNEKYLLNEGDVLFNRTNSAEHVGKSAIYRGEHEAIFAGYLVRVVYDKNQVSGEFLNQFLNSGIARRYGSTVMSKSVNQANISAGKLKKYPFPNLSLDQQEKISERVFAIAKVSSDLTEKYKAQLADIDDLRQSLLDLAFAGELTSATRDLAVNDNSRNEKLSAATLVLAYDNHCIEGQQKTFGHVKAQKTLHLTESIGGVNLGRQAKVRQAGPHDQEHFDRVEAWALKSKVFSFVQRRTGKRGYDFIPGTNYSAFLTEAKVLLADFQTDLSRFLPLITRMNSEQAEVFTTVHAAWNNLLADGKMPSDEDIVWASCEGWHKNKMAISRHKFFDAIREIRRNDLEPNGSAKYVHGAQESLL